MAESGARALGLPVIPGGTGETEMQLRAIADIRPTAYVGTPSFLLTLLERGQRLGLDTSSIKKALVSGRAVPRCTSGLAAGPVRDRGRPMLCHGRSRPDRLREPDVREGLIVDEAVIVEIVRPGTADPVPAGEVGEVVVTAFNPDYPLIRFATGDLSADLVRAEPLWPHQHAHRGWLGRADQAPRSAACSCIRTSWATCCGGMRSCSVPGSW